MKTPEKNRVRAKFLRELARDLRSESARRHFLERAAELEPDAQDESAYAQISVGQILH